jgi:hypothetical protein
MEKELSSTREQEKGKSSRVSLLWRCTEGLCLELRSKWAATVGELREARFRGRKGLETIFFAYDELLLMSTQELPSWVEKWAQEEQHRVRRELLWFPRVDQYGVVLKGLEEEDEGGEEVANTSGGEGGSRGEKEKTRE